MATAMSVTRASSIPSTASAATWMSRCEVR
jgi:hypothetical protein